MRWRASAALSWPPSLLCLLWSLDSSVVSGRHQPTRDVALESPQSRISTGATIAYMFQLQSFDLCFLAMALLNNKFVLSSKIYWMSPSFGWPCYIVLSVTKVTISGSLKKWSPISWTHSSVTVMVTQMTTWTGTEWHIHNTVGSPTKYLILRYVHTTLYIDFIFSDWHFEVYPLWGHSSVT